MCWPLGQRWSTVLDVEHGPRPDPSSPGCSLRAGGEVLEYNFRFRPAADRKSRLENRTPLADKQHGGHTGSGRVGGLSQRRTMMSLVTVEPRRMYETVSLANHDRPGLQDESSRKDSKLLCSVVACPCTFEFSFRGLHRGFFLLCRFYGSSAPITSSPWKGPFFLCQGNQGKKKIDSPP